jgi:hypothetical protein
MTPNNSTDRLQWSYFPVTQDYQFVQYKTHINPLEIRLGFLWYRQRSTAEANVKILASNISEFLNNFEGPTE